MKNIRHSLFPGLICHFLLFLIGGTHVQGQEKESPKLRNFEMMEWEFEKNQAFSDQRMRLRSHQVPKKFPLEYYEIPEELTLATMLPRTNQKILSAMKFEREGKNYFRWWIHPEDQIYHFEVEAYLKSHHQPITRHRWGEGRLSASRSCLACPFNDQDFHFFFKASTNRTGKAFATFHFKKVTDMQVDKSLLATDLTQKIKEVVNFQYLLTMEEPLGLRLQSTFKKVKDEDSSLTTILKIMGTLKKDVADVEKLTINQGMIIRSFENLTPQDHHLLPGFTAIHETEGPRVALLNKDDPDRNHPAVYWRKHYASPLGRATGEFIATHGLMPSNPHSQQYLIDLNSDYRPTGKILFRDYNDSYLFKPFFKDFKKTTRNFLKTWDNDFSKDELFVVFGIFHGSGVPSWLTKNDLALWSRDFYTSFEQSFSQVTGIPITQLKRERVQGSHDSYYIQLISAKITHPWRTWIRISPCLRGQKYLDNGLLCKDILQCHQKKTEKTKNILITESGFLCQDIMNRLFDFDQTRVKQLIKYPPVISEDSCLP